MICCEILRFDKDGRRRQYLGGAAVIVCFECCHHVVCHGCGGITPFIRPGDKAALDAILRCCGCDAPMLIEDGGHAA